VAACLYRGMEDTHAAFLGELDDATRDELYEGVGAGHHAAGARGPVAPRPGGVRGVLAAGLEKVHIDDTIRGYLYDLIELRFAHEPLRTLMAPSTGS
jgi:uncharacterized protein (DUF2236 family)